MKKSLFLLLTLFSVCTQAQNTWEMPKEPDPKAALDEKYAAGAIPMKDGLVCFSKTIKAQGKTLKQTYDIIHGYLQEMIAEPNQLQREVGYTGETEPISRIAYEDINSGVIAANIDEWLVFKRNAITLDRTEMKYVIIANCKDGSVEINITRIHYNYEKDRPGGFEEAAENVITDDWGLNKSKTKLAPTYGKFRRKTIDRVNYLFNTIEEKLK